MDVLGTNSTLDSNSEKRDGGSVYETSIQFSILVWKLDFNKMVCNN